MDFLFRIVGHAVRPRIGIGVLSLKPRNPQDKRERKKSQLSDTTGNDYGKLEGMDNRIGEIHLSITLQFRTNILMLYSEHADGGRIIMVRSLRSIFM